ncbi:MAG: phosphatase PAP2 family protein [Actinomycetota bacterium]|nr:phosphatase PAP2 family protein [Actinomycetota bacterium]
MLSEVGSPAIPALVAVVAAIVLWRRGQRLLLAIAPGLALGTSGICAAIGKTVVGRGRPPVPLHLVSETDASFPSGHATDATAVYLTLALLVAIYVVRRPLARCAWVLGSGLLAAAIGLSRLVLGVHWPTDVMPDGRSAHQSPSPSQSWQASPCAPLLTVPRRTATADHSPELPTS